MSLTSLTGASGVSHGSQLGLTGATPGSHRCLAGESVSLGLMSHRGLTMSRLSLTWISHGSHLGLTGVSPGFWVSPGSHGISLVSLGLTCVSSGSHRSLGRLTGVSPVSHRGRMWVSQCLSGGSVSPGLGSHRGLTGISRGLTRVSPESHLCGTGSHRGLTERASVSHGNPSRDVGVSTGSHTVSLASHRGLKQSRRRSPPSLTGVAHLSFTCCISHVPR